MGKRKTNYSSDWEKWYPWIKNVQKDASLAFCKLCDRTIWIDGGGITQIKTKARFHWILQMFPQSPSLRLFFHLKSQLQSWNIASTKTVDSSFSFASANGNGKLVTEMFPDSDIAKGYKQSELKIKYSF